MLERYHPKIYGSIYVATNLVNGKQYVGQTACKIVSKRWTGHFKNARSGRKSQLYSAIRKHGEAAFTFKVVETVSNKIALDKAEMFWIAKLNTLFPNGYNLTPGGSNGKHLEETKELLREMSLAIWEKPDFRQKQVDSWKDPKVRQARIDGIKAAYDRPEVRLSHSEGIKAALARPETKAKKGAISRAFQAKPEVIAKKSKASLEMWAQPGFKEATSAAMRAANFGGYRNITNGAFNRKIRRNASIPENWWVGRVIPRIIRGQPVMRKYEQVW